MYFVSMYFRNSFACYVQVLFPVNTCFGWVTFQMCFLYSIKLYYRDVLFMLREAIVWGPSVGMDMLHGPMHTISIPAAGAIALVRGAACNPLAMGACWHSTGNTSRSRQGCRRSRTVQVHHVWCPSCSPLAAAVLIRKESAQDENVMKAVRMRKLW